MEMMMQMLTSKLFLVFAALVVAYNMVRQRNRRIQSRSYQTQHSLKDRIRDRQIGQWDTSDQSDVKRDEDQKPEAQ